MRPYTQDKRGGFKVKDSRGMDVWRPNRTAAGMTYTAARSGHRLENKRDSLAPCDALTLAVKGTLARMARSEWAGAIRYIQVEPRRGITDKGRAILAKMKNKK